MNVPMTCSQCGKQKMIDRDDWERYYIEDESDFICGSCQLDIMDGYLPLEKKNDPYGRTGKQEDNSLGTFKLTTK